MLCGWPWRLASTSLGPSWFDSSVRERPRITKNNMNSSFLRERGSASISSSISTFLAIRRIYLSISTPFRMSYGNGRPAILKEDDNVRYSHELLAHPLSIEDDARLASTVELMILRERGHHAWQNVTIPGDRNFSEEQHAVLQNTIDDFRYALMRLVVDIVHLMHNAGSGMRHGTISLLNAMTGKRSIEHRSRFNSYSQKCFISPWPYALSLGRPMWNACLWFKSVLRQRLFRQLDKVSTAACDQIATARA
jgi:hypothetical protein